MMSVIPSPGDKMFATIYKVLQSCSKMVEMLSESQTAWIRLRRRLGFKLLAYDTTVAVDRVRVNPPIIRHMLPTIKIVFTLF